MRALAIVALATACNGPPDAICSLGSNTPAQPEATIVATPSLACYREGSSSPNPAGGTIPGPLIPSGECPSSTCLAVPLSNALPAGSIYPPPGYGLSTVECASDDDCIAESPCVSGFTCGVPPALTVGPSCCEKLCICRDYVAVPPSGLPTPAACDPTNADNACCNLAGRENEPSYPLCRS
ncbi:MAG TPA: hypothetical protein VGG74_28760 [Kofleriaceae bacterium]|jgi:hypothetical protein